MSTVYEAFFKSGEVVELRALGMTGKNKAWEGWCRYGTVSGYYNDPVALERDAQALEQAGATGIYFTLNPCKPELLARRVNRCVADPKQTTSDADIACIRWLPLDLDPKRPAGISSTDEELAKAWAYARRIEAWLLEKRDIRPSIIAESGNGVHMLIRLPDLPNDARHVELVRGGLHAIAQACPDEAVDLDLKVYNPARIWKYYGTIGRKGDSTPERPHRVSKVVEAQPEVPPVSPEVLEALAASGASSPAAGGVPSNPPGSPSSPPDFPVNKPGGDKRRLAPGDLGTLDLGKYLDHYHRRYKTKPKGEATMYILLEGCVFDQNHRGGEAAIVQSPSPPFLAYQCFHNSCAGRTWKEARRIISGEDSLAPFCANYDPDRARKSTENLPTGIRVQALAAPDAVHTVTSTWLPDPFTDDISMLDDIKLPPPEDVDPLWFHDRKGRGITYVPMRMALYVQAWLYPLVHTEGIYYRYQDGFWQPYSEHDIKSIITRAMGQTCQGNWVGNTMTLLAGAANVSAKKWPVHTHLINCQNGMLDLQDGFKLIPHHPRFGSRAQVAAAYDKDAEAPRWFQYLTEVFPDKGEDEKATILQEFFGYTLLPDCRYQKCLFLIGTGANGKSKTLDALTAMLGQENVSSLTIHDITERFQLSSLENKLANVATEINTKDPTSSELFKSLVAGEVVRVEEKYQPSRFFRNRAKFIMAMNDVPSMPDRSYGFARRLIVMGYRRRFEEHEMDPELDQKLAAERDGIFNWSVFGLERLLRQNGFTRLDITDADREDFLHALNPFLIFVEENCEFGRERYVPCQEFYKDYKAWCVEAGHRNLSRNKFYEQVLQNYPQLKKTKIDRGTHRVFSGIGLMVEST